MALYPRAWRARYGDELEALLDVAPPGLRDRFDLLRGALDAHLHPARPSPLPVVAALTASALATAHAIALAAQPVPLDWPGYLEEALPLVIGSVAALLPAIVGLWLKLGDADGALGRLGVVVALGGHLAWLVALLAAAWRVEYGPLTAIAATVADGRNGRPWHRARRPLAAPARRPAVRRGARRRRATGTRLAAVRRRMDRGRRGARACSSPVASASGGGPIVA